MASRETQQMYDAMKRGPPPPPPRPPPKTTRIAPLFSPPKTTRIASLFSSRQQQDQQEQQLRGMFDTANKEQGMTQ